MEKLSFDLFKNKSILIVGLGVTGISAFELLKNLSQCIKCTDNKEEKLKSVSNKYGDNYVISNHLINDDILSRFDYILISPGIPKDHYLYKYAIKNNVLISDFDVLFELNPNAYYIGVTGTDGKSTTCKIIYEIMLQNKKNYELGGNIGVPALNLPHAEGYILEISSYQLDLLKSSCLKKFQLDIGILLNIHESHLDVYKNMYNYAKSKSYIFNIINKNGLGIICVNDDLCENIASNIIKKKNFRDFYFILSDKFADKLSNVEIKKSEGIHVLKLEKNNILDNQNNEICSVDKFNFAGLNTKYTCAVVIQIARIFSFKINVILGYLQTFKGLQHRLEVVLDNKHAVFINDSKSTNINCCVNAIGSFENIYWISGGVFAEQDLSEVFKMKQRIIKAYFFGEAANNLFRCYKHYMQCDVYENLKDVFIAVIKDVSRQIKINNNKKYTILFSPGHQSFDQFQNFVERGNYFTNLCLDESINIIK